MGKPLKSKSNKYKYRRCLNIDNGIVKLNL